MSSATDVGMFVVLISIFIITGAFLSFIQKDLGVTQTNNNIAQFNELGESIDSDINIVNATPSGFAIISGIFKMFFFTFGDLVFWLDILFIIPRVIFWVLFVRMLRGQ